MVELAENSHYVQVSKGKWEERYFLGTYWGTGEALVGSAEGIRRAALIRRVGGHRRWDAEGLAEAHGVPWSWNPDAEVHPGDIRVRFLAE